MGSRMEIPQVNYLAVLVGAVVYYLLGAVWYQPGVFGKAWMKAIGKTQEELRQAGGAAPAVSMIGMFVLCFVGVIGLAWIATWADLAAGDATTVVGNIGVALVSALAFHFVAWGTTVLFDQRSWTYFLINLGYHTVGLVLAAVVLAVWP